MREVIQTSKAPAAIGAYSQAIAINASKMLYVSGQLGIAPETNAMISDQVAAQAEQALKNLNSILQAAGLTKNHVVKTTIFLKDMNDFPTVNEIYAAYFNFSPPARSTIEVARLPKDAKVEIEAIAAS